MTLDSAFEASAGTLDPRASADRRRWASRHCAWVMPLSKRSPLAQCR